MIAPLYDMYNDFRNKKRANDYKELYSYGEKLQKDAGVNNTLQYFESKVVPKLQQYAKKQNIEIDADKQYVRLMNYLLYYIDVSDELPDELVYDGWQNSCIVDYIVCLEEDGDSVPFACHPYQYYIYRNHRLPPTDWFVDKIRDRSEMDSIRFYEIIYENFTSDDIIKLSQLIVKRDVDIILYELVKHDLVEKTLHHPTKFIDKLQDLFKQHIIAIFELFDLKLPDELKFDGYQTQVNNGRTLFSLYIENQLYDGREYIPPKDLWFDGCLQRKYCFGAHVPIKDSMQFLYLTPAQFVSYEKGSMPPKELLYPGWEKENVTVKFCNNSTKMLFAHLWFLYHIRYIPKYLQCDGWNTQKFIYAIIHQTIHKLTRAVQFYGTIYGAYNYYGIVDINDARFDKYKLSNKAQCVIYFEEKTTYNLCKNQHRDGICLDCLINMEHCECPICKSDQFQHKYYDTTTYNKIYRQL